MRIGLRILLPVVAVSLLAAGQAGAIDQWPDTGQEACYDTDGNIIDCTDTGQDHEFINIRIAHSYTKLDASGTPLDDQTADTHVAVRDNVTGLIWEVKSTDAGSNNYRDDTYAWDARDTYIATLNGASYGGRTDWRMPTPSELGTLVDSGHTTPAIDSVFSHTQSGFYWTSKQDVDNNHEAIGVDANLGKIVGRTHTEYEAAEGECVTHSAAGTCDAETLFIRAVAVGVSE